MFSKKRIPLAIVAVLLTSLTAFSQVNIKVAYNLGYTKPAELEKLVNEFNLINDYRISNPMTSIAFVSGIDVGLRYKFGTSNIELSFENLSTDKEALGEEPADGSLFRERYFYNQNGLNLVIESRINQLGWGIGLMRRTQLFRTNISTSDVKRDILKNHTMAIRFQTSINFDGSGNISFALKPFYIYPLSKTDLGPLAEEWGIPAENIGTERFETFGISFIFYNGPQG